MYANIIKDFMYAYKYITIQFTLDHFIYIHTDTNE